MKTKLSLALLAIILLSAFHAPAAGVEGVQGPMFVQVGRSYHIEIASQGGTGIANSDVTVIGSGGAGWYRVEYYSRQTAFDSSTGKPIQSQATKAQAWLNFAHVILAQEIAPIQNAPR